MERLGSHSTAVHEILYYECFLKILSRNSQVSLKSENKNTVRADQYTFFISLSVLLVMRDVSDESCKQRKNTYFVLNDFFS